MKEPWITIATFTYPPEGAVIKSRLEAEGIACIMKDELTVQVYSFYSNAIGGVKLQVMPEDKQKALSILGEAGYVEQPTSDKSTIWRPFKKLTDKIPIIKNIAPSLRFLALAALILGAAATIIVIQYLPDTFEQITTSNWCVKSLKYEGKFYRVNTTGLRLTGKGFCDENLKFNANNRVHLPGFNSSEITGEWILDEDSLQIKSTSQYGYVYENNYQLEMDEKALILRSRKTTIYCFRK